ncbi:MAG TPA: ATP-binding protein [Rudaea sp.]|nr:ATP-binding protein [Rudaea sp.]
MHRLFWRIFALFWAAMVALIIAIAWITSNNFENEKLPGLDVTRMDFALNDELRSAAHALRDGGIAGLHQRIADMQSLRGVVLYVLGADGSDILGRPVPPGVADAAAHPVQDSEGLHANRMRVRPLVAPDGARYTAVATFHGSPLLRMLYRRQGTFWTHVAVAMVISACFSLLLAAYITAPLARIRASARRVARGDLSARVGDLPFGQSAEILALAREFDQMAARLKELVEGQQRLIRDVSHEMRSPLSRLRVALELARSQVSGDAATQLARIERESERLEEMIAQAIQLSRMETTTTPSQVQDVALDELLSDIVADAAFEAQARQCTLHVAQSAPLRVRAEVDLLTSAIENVVRNAVNYTAAQTSIDLRLDRVDGQARLRVRDCGPGVPAGDCLRIFEPYFRTDAARQRKSGGSGLGLAIAKRAIERQGGRIQAQNIEGGGLEVEILLPLA